MIRGAENGRASNKLFKMRESKGVPIDSRVPTDMIPYRFDSNKIQKHQRQKKERNETRLNNYQRL